MRLRYLLRDIILFSFVFFLFQLSFLLYGNSLKAQQSSVCESVYSSCAMPCNGENEDQCYLPDFDCMNRRLVNPTVRCCIHKCAGTISDVSSDVVEFYRQFNFFGTKVNVRTDNLVGWITLSIQAFLGVISLVALLRGIKIGVIDIPNALDSESRKKASVAVVNTIIGFTLAWGTIFIMQIVLSVLGLPGLNELVLFGDLPEGARTTIVID